MLYRKVGQSGLKVSALSIGAWLTAGKDVDEQDFHRVLHQAFERGVNFLDLADIYARGQAELICGRFLKDFPRHQVVLSSKCYWPMSEGVNDRGLSRKHIMESVEGSLKRLGTDYLDLYFCHRYDENTPLEETVRAMSDLVQQGKILYWGTSVWSAQQLKEAHRVASHTSAYAPIVEQPMYNLHERGIELDVIPTAESLGMGLVVWSPLAGGVLTGKYANGIPADSRGASTQWLETWLDEDSQIKNKRFVELAKEVGVTPGQLALAWLLKRPQISSVITGATKADQIKENLGALDVQVSEEIDQEIDQLFR
jgi:voltage-dependent potassium channel beta subunit